MKKSVALSSCPCNGVSGDCSICQVEKRAHKSRKTVLRMLGKRMGFDTWSIYEKKWKYSIDGSLEWGTFFSHGSLIFAQKQFYDGWKTNKGNCCEYCPIFRYWSYITLLWTYFLRPRCEHWSGITYGSVKRSRIDMLPARRARTLDFFAWIQCFLTLEKLMIMGIKYNTTVSSVSSSRV